ncbi:MAG: hypothetical protein U0528_01260 [Anaerolineae bacterium]|nr:hypothetical protein [Anaerolineae bacterium]
MDVDSTVHALIPIIQQIIQGVMKSNGVGLFSAISMAKGLADFLKDAPTRFVGNDIVSGIIKNVLHGGAEGEPSHAPDEPYSLANLDLDVVMVEVGKVNDLLASTGEVGRQTKTFIYELGEAVAKASGSGLFGRGEKINAQEADFLSKLKTVLGLS